MWIKRILEYILKLKLNQKENQRQKNGREGKRENDSNQSDLVITDVKKVIQSYVLNDIPNFVKDDKPNFATSPNTIKLRKIISDEFGGGKMAWDLQCTEYVQYKIKMSGINIEWPVKNNRNGGNWATIFEKFGPYKILNEPKMGCAACFVPTAKNPFGHIAFVENTNVSQEEIMISEANYPGQGKYNYRSISKLSIQNNAIRFIDFTDRSNITKERDLGLGVTCELEDNTIFFAYSDRDKILASKIKSELKKYNFDVFLACEDLDLSECWFEKNRKEIYCRRFFISLRTDNFFNSICATQEEGMAIILDKNIIPLFVNVDPKDSGYLYKYHGLIFNDQEIERDCHKLVEGILKLKK